VKVLKEFQVCGETAFSTTFKVGESFDPKKENITQKSVEQLLAGGFIEVEPVTSKKESK
jgi:hypothetical protein